MDAIVDSMTPIGCQGWPGLACQWLDELKGRGDGLPRSNPRKCCLSPTDNVFFRATVKNEWQARYRVEMGYIRYNVYNCRVWK